jgi:hypothetical protein
VHGESDCTSVALVAEAFSHVDPALYDMTVGITEKHPVGTYWTRWRPWQRRKKSLAGRHESVDYASETESEHNRMTSSRISVVFLA